MKIPEEINPSPVNHQSAYSNPPRSMKDKLSSSRQYISRAISVEHKTSGIRRVLILVFIVGFVGLLLTCCFGGTLISKRISQTNTPTAIPTSTSSPTTTPTWTPTLTITNTPTATMTLTPTPIIGCVTSSSLRVRKGPGTNFEIVTNLTGSDCVEILGRTEASDWAFIRINIDTSILEGWVSFDYLDVDSAVINSLIVVEAP